MTIEFDYSKLRGKIKEVYGNQILFANNLGISHVSLSAKLNNKVGFTQEEMYMAKKLLKFNVEETTSYFFKRKV